MKAETRPGELNIAGDFCSLQTAGPWPLAPAGHPGLVARAGAHLLLELSADNSNSSLGLKRALSWRKGTELEFSGHTKWQLPI